MSTDMLWRLTNCRLLLLLIISLNMHDTKMAQTKINSMEKLV